MSKVMDVLKVKGLELAEEQVKMLIEGLFEVAEEVINESENKYDDMVKASFPLVKGLLLGLVDKIDGK